MNFWKWREEDTEKGRKGAKEGRREGKSPQLTLTLLLFHVESFFRLEGSHVIESLLLPRLVYWQRRAIKIRCSPRWLLRHQDHRIGLSEAIRKHRTGRSSRGIDSTWNNEGKKERLGSIQRKRKKESGGFCSLTPSTYFFSSPY